MAESFQIFTRVFLGGLVILALSMSAFTCEAVWGVAVAFPSSRCPCPEEDTFRNKHFYHHNLKEESHYSTRTKSFLNHT